MEQAMMEEITRREIAYEKVAAGLVAQGWRRYPNKTYGDVFKTRFGTVLLRLYWSTFLGEWVIVEAKC